jgi:hypothetical protein
VGVPRGRLGNDLPVFIRLAASASGERIASGLGMFLILSFIQHWPSKLCSDDRNPRRPHTFSCTSSSSSSSLLAFAGYLATTYFISSLVSHILPLCSHTSSANFDTSTPARVLRRSSCTAPDEVARHHGLWTVLHAKASDRHLHTLSDRH